MISRLWRNEVFKWKTTVLLYTETQDSVWNIKKQDYMLFYSNLMKKDHHEDEPQHSVIYTREYRMIYRGTDFLAIVWFGSSPTPSSPSHQQVVSPSQYSCVSPVELTDGNRMIWLLPPPLFPLTSASCIFFSIFLCIACRAYWRERGWVSGTRSQIRLRESLALYKSFNTLWDTRWCLKY